LASGLTYWLQRKLRTSPVKALVSRINTWMLTRPPLRIKVEGQVLLAATLDRLTVLMLQKFKSSESYAVDLWRRLCRPGSVVLDVGANLGLYALVAAEQVGAKGRVHAFEADPDNIRLLQGSAALNQYSNLSIHGQAVTNHSGSVKLFLRPEHKGDSQLSYNGPDRKFVTVPATTLDEALSPEPHVDLIKFDIQGAEALAIQGMHSILAASPGLKVITEFWPQGLARCGMEPAEFLDWWRSKGFSLSRIDEEQRELLPIDDYQALLQYCQTNQDANLFMERRPGI
jgi:FkbM family methyltransferase